MPKPISFFYPGQHTDSRGNIVKVALAQLKEAVAHFNKSGHRLPLVVGHPKTNDDVFGEATKLDVSPDGTVKAVEFSGVDPTFEKIVNSGELPKVSVKLRLPGHPKNSYSGIEFDHLGFFGRSDVALSKLPFAEFSAPTQFEAEFMPPSVEELEARAAELAEREAAFAKRTAEARVNNLVAAGVVTPKDKAGMIEIFQGLEATAAFSAPGHDSDYENQADFLEKAFAKKAIPVGRQSDPEPEDDEPADYDDPLAAGFSKENATEASLDKHKKVMAFAKKNKVNYNAAVKMMAKDSKEAS